MSEPRLYAVITGDIIRSRSLNEEERTLVLTAIKQIHHQVSRLAGTKAIIRSFEIFRGDSFQGLLSQPEYILDVAVLLRASVRRCLKKEQKKLPDVRVAIGIGTIDNIPEKISEGNGEAYRSSGRLLDMMQNEQNLKVATPWPSLDKQLNVSCGLLDLIINKWTFAQSDIIPEIMFGHIQTKIAAKRGLTQAAVHNRLKTAGWNMVKQYLEYVRESLSQYIGMATNYKTK